MSRLRTILIVVGLLMVGVLSCSLAALPIVSTLTLASGSFSTTVVPATATPVVAATAPTAQATTVRSLLPTVAPSPTPLAPNIIAEADAEELLLVNLYERVNPSVVNIVILQEGQSTAGLNNLFPTQGQGTGFVYDTEGHIVTNNHVVHGADRIEVNFSDGLRGRAELVGSDRDSDLAVLKIDVPAESLRPVTWGDSSALKVGQRAVAIGNPFGLDGSLTSGIVSALKRRLPTEGGTFSIPEIIQTDAAINPGNSGGPLLNSAGEVIGVNTAIVPRRSSLGERSFLGVGFAVPSNLVLRVVPALIEDGSYQHPWLGFSGDSVTPEIADAINLAEARGAFVVNVISGSPADEAGLRGGTRDFEVGGFVTQIGGDVIVGIEDESIITFDDILSFLSRRGEVGQTVAVHIIRDGELMTLPVTLAGRPDAGDRQ